MNVNRYRLHLLSGFLLIYLLSGGVASAGALTSIVVKDKQYNLYIYDSREHDKPIQAFNNTIKFKHRSEQVNYCSFAIDLPVGVAHGNHSYGGICDAVVDGKTESVMLCTDEMVGHFALQPVERNGLANEINALAAFTASHCYGG